MSGNHESEVLDSGSAKPLDDKPRLTDYAKAVFRFGGPDAYKTEGGRRFNLKQKQDFDCEQVFTDGRGNVPDMNVLLRKPCFGRPEAYLFHGLYHRKLLQDPLGVKGVSYSRCDECNAQPACNDLAIERIDSDPKIRAKFHEFDDAVGAGASTSPLRSTRLRVPWTQFLQTIKEHGGWTNVNDLRSLVEEQRLNQARKERKKTKRKARRQARKDAYAGKAKPITPEFLEAVEEERDRRLGVLMTIRDWKDGPRWVTKLLPEGCERTANVWKAMTIMNRAGHEIACKAVAQWLIDQELEPGGALPSLTSRVNEANGRIKKLEDDSDGTPIWARFAWTP